MDADAYVKRFYAQADEAEDAYRLFRNYTKDGDFDAAKAYRQEELGYVTMGRLVNTYRERIAALRDRAADISASDLPKAEKNALLDRNEAKIIKTATMFNDRLKRLR